MRGHSELSGNKVKKRLMELLGSDEVNLNDPEFMRTLCAKIDEEYQMSERQKMKNLQDLERKRERKLALEGIIEGESDHNRERKKWSDYVEHRPAKEEDYFEENAFEGPPTGNYSLREKMRRDMEENECRREHSEAREEKGDSEEEEKKDEKEKAEGEEEEAAEGAEEKPAAAEENGGEAAATEGGEEQQEGEEAAKSGEEDGAGHPCSFLNRPYSARVERLIQEETLEGLFDLAKEMVFVGTK